VVPSTTKKAYSANLLVVVWCSNHLTQQASVQAVSDTALAAQQQAFFFGVLFFRNVNLLILSQANY